MATKKCPFCAEEIQEEAIVCKHCQSRLDALPSPTETNQQHATILQPQTASGETAVSLRESKPNRTILYLVPVLLVAAIAIYIVVGVGWKTYSGEGFSFRYASKWEIAGPEVLSLFDPQPLVMLYTDGTLASNVSVGLVDDAADLSLEGYADAVVADYRTQGYLLGMSDYCLLSHTNLRVGDYSGYVIVGEWVIGETGQAARQMQLFVSYGQRMYVMTATCPKDNWERDRAVFDKMVSSFRVK